MPCYAHFVRCNHLIQARNPPEALRFGPGEVPAPLQVCGRGLVEERVCRANAFLLQPLEDLLRKLTARGVAHPEPQLPDVVAIRAARQGITSRKTPHRSHDPRAGCQHIEVASDLGDVLAARIFIRPSHWVHGIKPGLQLQQAFLLRMTRAISTASLR